MSFSYANGQLQDNIGILAFSRALCNLWSGVMEWSLGVESWSGVWSGFMEWSLEWLKSDFKFLLPFY